MTTPHLLRRLLLLLVWCVLCVGRRGEAAWRQFVTRREGGCSWRLWCGQPAKEGEEVAGGKGGEGGGLLQRDTVDRVQGGLNSRGWRE